MFIGLGKIAYFLYTIFRDSKLKN